MLVLVGNRIPENQKPAYMRRPTHGCPIDKLPDDILLEIFLIGLAVQLDLRDNKEEGGWGPGRNEFQEAMSYVCRRWRNIAVNAPLLWRRLEFGDGPPFSRTSRYIRRSRDTPLEIVIDCTRVKQRTLDYYRDEWDWTGCGDDITKPRRQTYFFDLVDPRDVSDILDFVLPHVARWRLFRLKTDNYTVLVNILKAISSFPEAPALKILSFVFNDEYFAGNDQDLEVLHVPFSGNAPQLQDLELIKVSLDWTRCKFLQPGSVLSRLKMHYHPQNSRPTFDSFFQWLQGAPRLATLQLRDAGPAGDPAQWPNWPPLELRSVTRLYLEYLEHAELAALLVRLQFPKLRTLTLKVEAWDGDKTTAVLCDHIPLERLHELDVAGLLISTVPDNDRFWGSFRRLRMLRISEETVENALFERVWKRPETMPRLRSLMTAGIEGDKLQALVRGRRTARPLKTLRVHKADKVSRAQEKWLSHNVDFAYFGDPELDESESESESDEDMFRYVSDPERYDDQAWVFRTMSP